MSDREYPPRDGIRMGMVDGEYGRAIAFRIRAELVCCHLYDQVGEEAAKLKKAGDPKAVQHAIARAVLRREWHELCYWGEASAQIAEGRCPGYETEPNVCQCPCKGCKHNCGAHQEETPWQPTS